jgi:molecular chaperone GrpE
LEELDSENKAFMKRLENEMERKREASMMELFNSLLEVADNFDRALENACSEHSFDELMKGVRMIRDHFINVLMKSEVTPLDILDTPFVPDLAEAIGVVDVADPGEDNVIKEELVKGYKYKDKLLRPAKVRVGQCKKKR